MAVQINDYVGTSGASHWTVAWVTTESGDFIKSLRKQGTSYPFNSTQWTDHCPQWNAARGGVNGSTVVDGYTSATASNYSGTNSPVILTWNCRDTNNVLVADGKYKFWVQYAENTSGVPGPFTTNGLLWAKGPTSVTTNYANLGANFTGMQVAWTPNAPSGPSTFTSVAVNAGDLVMSGTGPANGTYAVLTANSANTAMNQWTPIATNSFSPAGSFTYSTPLSLGTSQKFYRLRVP